MINTVIFDVGGVLANYHAKDYFIQLGYAKEKADQLRNATQDNPAWKEYDRGVLTDEEVRSRFKKDAPDLSKEIDASLTHMYHLVTRKEEAVPWIDEVRQKGCRTYVLSNFSKTAYADCQDALDFQSRMDGCFWSYQHHVIKPDLSCYLTMLYTFHIQPENSVFIDDTKANLLNAEKLGIHTILYQNQAQAEEDLNTLLTL